MEQNEMNEILGMENSQDQNDDTKANSPKQRHGCVTAWLILMIIANSLIAIVYLFASEKITDNLPGDVSPSLIILLGIIGVANVFFASLLYQWKKWGFWGFIVTSIGALIINLSIGANIAQSLFGLVGIGILYGILQIKKDNVTAWENLE
jgi:hypothetical protein